jgi:hypothetical protein
VILKPFDFLLWRRVQQKTSRLVVARYSSLQVGYKRKKKVMSKSLLVTSGQMEAVRQMANEKGISRSQFQQGLDDGGLSRYLDTLKFGGITIPPGARIHLLTGVTVTLDQDWQEAVNTAGPNTPADYNVRKVGDLYKPTGKGKVVCDYVALNFTRGDGWQAALAWAKEQKLESTTPREAFVVAEHNPTLHKVLGQNPMRLAATTECTFGGFRRAGGVWWRDAKSGANLHWVSYFGLGYDWFLFRKPSVLVA